jgi:hypothetical protein
LRLWSDKSCCSKNNKVATPTGKAVPLGGKLRNTETASLCRKTANILPFYTLAKKIQINEKLLLTKKVFML